MHSFLIFTVYLMGTLSYVSSLNISAIKYLSIFITLAMVIVDLRSNHWNISKSTGTPFITLFFALVFSATLQSTSLNQKLFSLFFYVVLLCWMLMGVTIIGNTKDVMYAGIGIALGVIAGLSLSTSMVISQLNSIYNTRSRLYGGFTHPNHLGAIAAAGIIALLCYLFLENDKKKLNIVACIVMIVVLSIVLYMTKSRTSWIVVMVFLAVYMLRHIRNLQLRTRFFICALGALGLSYLIYFFWTSYVSQDAAYTGRLAIFDTMIVTLKTFFVGNGMVGSASLDRTNTGGGAMEIAWVMLFYKNGIIGIISYIVLLSKLFFDAKSILEDKQRWAFYAVLAALLISTLGEAFLCNITNLSPMLEIVLLSALSSNRFVIGGQNCIPEQEEFVYE